MLCSMAREGGVQCAGLSWITPGLRALVQKSDLAGADFTAKLFQGLSSRKKIFIFGALIAKTNEN